MARKKVIRFNAKNEKFLIDKICSGMDVAAIVRRYPDKLPTLSAINQRQVRDEEFNKKVTGAYTVLFQQRLDEMNTLSSGLASEHYPDAPFKEAEAALKRRIDSLKLQLTKLAPTLSDRFDKPTKLEISSKDGAPLMSVINYHAEPKQVNNILEHDDD